MNLLVKDAFDNETPVGDIDFPGLAQDLGYMALGHVSQASHLAAALRQYGPVFVLGAGKAREHIISGVNGNEVSFFDLAKQKFASQPFGLFLPANLDKMFVAPIFGSNPEGVFTELQAVRDGCSNYHANHFISYFRCSTVTPLWIYKFFQNFDDVFNMENIASLEKTDYSFNRKAVVKFAINGIPGWVHHDYVALSRGRNRNFYGTTLKRDWRYGFEDALNVFDPFNFVSIDDEGYAVNSRHFLAGRRSWKFGHVQDDLYFIETAAIERYSHPAYQLSEDMGMIQRQMLVDVWTHLLNNTLTYFAQNAVDAASLLPGYTVVTMSRGDTYYREINSDRLSVIKADPAFQAVYQRHPEIVP